MFAPKVVKPRTKSTKDPAIKLTPLQRAIGNQASLRPAGRYSALAGSGHNSGEAKEIFGESTPAGTTHRGISWDFCKVALFPPEPARRVQPSFPPPATLIRGAIQAKLIVGQTNDPLEQEADGVADRVMSMVGPSPSTMGSSPPASHKCAACEGNEKVQRLTVKPAGSAEVATSEAPPIVHEVLHSSGRPLDAATRAFIEPRFGHDFSQVRVHANAGAAESSRALNARAYTVGRDIVFGAGQYRPQDASGQRLLAHELAHVVQQNAASVASVQRTPCRSPAQCAAPIAGAPGQFSVTEDAAQAALKAAATPCQAKPRHKDPATNIKALALGSGLGVAIPPQVHGIFIDKCLASADGQTQKCAQFAGGAPTGAPPDQLCVSVTEADENRAQALQAKPHPLSGADRQKEAELSALIQHESQHARFDTAAAAIVPAAADCNLATAVPDGTDVEFQLSEMSAGMAEFDIYFKNQKAAPTRASVFRMQTAEHDIATRGGESILGAIKTLQCACACNTVDTFTVKVFNDASSSWTAEEKTEFQKAMTGFMPSFWPKSLQKKK